MPPVVTPRAMARRRAAGRRPRSRGSIVATLLAAVVAGAWSGADGGFAGEPADGVEEYMLESPRLVDEYLQAAVKEAREAPGFEPPEDGSRPNFIFPGGPVHERALRAGRERDLLRLAAPLPVDIPAGLDSHGPALALEEGGEDPAARYAARSGAGDANATASADGAAGDDRRPSSPAAPPPAPNAWGATDALGGFLVGDNSSEDGPEGEAREAEERATAYPAASTRSPSSALESGSASSGETSSVASGWSRRRRRGYAAGKAIASGAVANSGALPSPSEWADAAREDLSALDVGWLVAAEKAEARARAEDSPLSDHDALYANMTEWFVRRGGVLDGVELATIAGKPGDGRGLVSTRRLALGDVVLRVPSSATLSVVSARNLRFGGQNVGEALKDALAGEHPQWALATLLLHEWTKEHSGIGSRWGPYLRTLAHAAPGTATLRKLRGTYASEVLAERMDEPKRAVAHLSKTLCQRAAVLCQRKPGKPGSALHTPDDLRWALGVVRARATWVTRRTTGTKFLALAPFLDLVPHHPAIPSAREGGVEPATLELDNAISMHAGASVGSAGAEMACRREEAATDAEAFANWHALAPGANPRNAVRLSIPGADVADAGLIEKVQKLRRWRREMAMPPRGADLWRGASKLGLYGDGDEELEAMKTLDSRSRRLGRGDGFAALAPSSEDGVTVEEEMMLTGQARDAEDAAAKAAAFVGLSAAPFSGTRRGAAGEARGFALYDAPEPDEESGEYEPAFEYARRDLARLALQTQAAATHGEYVDAEDEDEEDEEIGGEREASEAANEKEANVSGGDALAATEPEPERRPNESPRSDGGDAASRALRVARDFFETGAPPPRGLDDLDQFLLRKGRLMARCGAPRDFLIRRSGPSPALMCATRVLLANETEVGALEGGDGPPAWFAGAGERWTGGEAEKEKAASEKAGDDETRRGPRPFDATRPLSASNERAALERLGGVVAGVLASYPDDEAGDLAFLRGEGGLGGGEDGSFSDGVFEEEDLEEEEEEEEGGYLEDLASEDPPEEALGGGARVIMPSPVRVPGGLARTAVALRVRERRLLASAMRWLARRRASLERLEYQVDERERMRRAFEAEAEARRARADALRVEYATPKRVAAVEVDVVVPPEHRTPERPEANRAVTVEVREGDDRDAVVRAFVAEHALVAGAAEALTRALAEKTPPQKPLRAPLVAAVAVIVPRGSKVPLAVREGDDVEDLARVFAGIHEIPDELVPELARRADEAARKRVRRRAVTAVDVDAPDGRRLRCEVREGEEHDLERHVSEWALVERVTQGAVGQIADAIRARLPPVLVAFPVDVPGRARLTFEARARDEEEVRRGAEAFAEVNALEEGAARAIARNALQRLNHGSVLIDAEPTGGG